MGSETESELHKAEREDKERKELLNEVLKEIELFNLKQDEDEAMGSDLENFQDEDADENKIHIYPPGIKFFNGDVNCIYNQCSIQNEQNLQCKFEKVDEIALMNIERMVLYDYFGETMSSKKALFQFLLKLLFTYQTRNYLDTVSCILLELINKMNQTNLLLEVALDSLPLGLRNLGGKTNGIYKNEALPEDNVATIIKGKKDFNPLENIRYVLRVLQCLITKEKKLSKDKLSLSIPTLDNLVYFLLTVSQDSLILSSNLLSSIQNLFAVLLDLYPSDSEFPEKVQDIVEFLGMFWDDSPEGFNHLTASFVTCDVVPLSRRGKHLKGSLAYYVLMCCLSPDEVEVMHIVHLSTLAKYCYDNLETIKAIDFSTHYSIFKVIDAAIDRPISNEKDKESLSFILKTLTSSQSSKSCKIDWYYKLKLESIAREMTSDWERLLDGQRCNKRPLY